MVLSALLGISLAGALELATRHGVLSPRVYPVPSRIVDLMYSGVIDGAYTDDTLSTLGASLAGFLIAVVGSVLIAGVLVSFPRLERIVMPYIVGFQTLPKVAVGPIVLLMIGFTWRAKVVLVVIVCFFPILVNALQGLRLRQRDTFELLVSLGATRWQLFWHLRVPGSASHMFAGFEVGIVFALLGAVVAELIGAPDGLGVRILREQARFNVQGMWAILIILMLIGAVLRWSVSIAERRVAFWSSESSDVLVSRAAN